VGGLGYRQHRLSARGVDGGTGRPPVNSAPLLAHLVDELDHLDGVLVIGLARLMIVVTGLDLIVITGLDPVIHGFLGADRDGGGPVDAGPSPAMTINDSVEGMTYMSRDGMAQAWNRKSHSVGERWVGVPA
jgi:hypothetical protein